MCTSLISGYAGTGRRARSLRRARSAGTLDYVAPEQIEGRALDGRADLYSLACAGFEPPCGTPPFGQDQSLTVMTHSSTRHHPRLRRGALTCPRQPTWCWPRRLRRTRQIVMRPVAGSPKNCARRWGSSPASQITAHGCAGQGHARPVAESRLACGDKRPARQQDFGHEPTQTPAPVQSGPGRPMFPEDQPAAGLGQVSRDSIGGPGGPYPRQPRRRPGVIRLALAVAAVGIAAAVAIGVALPGRSTPGTPLVLPRRVLPRPGPRPNLGTVIVIGVHPGIPAGGRRERSAEFERSHPKGTARRSQRGI